MNPPCFGPFSLLLLFYHSLIAVCPRVDAALIFPTRNTSVQLEATNQQRHILKQVLDFSEMSGNCSSVHYLAASPDNLFSANSPQDTRYTLILFFVEQQNGSLSQYKTRLEVCYF